MGARSFPARLVSAKPSDSTFLLGSRQCRRAEGAFALYFPTFQPDRRVSGDVKTCKIDRVMLSAERNESEYRLAIETSSRCGSVALGCGDCVLASRDLEADRAHAVELLPTINDLCCAHSVEPTRIGVIFVSIGPGSFTGLRIGVTSARMLALGSGARIVPVPTLEAIAQNALNTPRPLARVAVLVDARRGRAYAAAFTRQAEHTYAPASEPAEVDPAGFLVEQARVDPTCGVLGSGALGFAEAVGRSGLFALPESLFAPKADVVYRLGVRLATLGRFVDHRFLVPLYIRRPEAEEKWAQRHPERAS